MSVFGQECERYESEIDILNLKIEYLENILKTLKININDD